MNRAQYFRERYAYNQWANNRVLDCAATLSDEELACPRDGTAYGSLAKDFQHLVDAQNWWESIVRSNTTPGEDPAAPETSVVAVLRDRFNESHAALKRLCESLTDEALGDDATYTGRAGDQHVFPRWQMLEHLAGHGSQHRGEIGMVLHGLGRSPGDIDFLDYIEITGG